MLKSLFNNLILLIVITFTLSACSDDAGEDDTSLPNVMGGTTVSITKATDGAEPATDASFVVTVTPTNNTGSAINGDISYTGHSYQWHRLYHRSHHFLDNRWSRYCHYNSCYLR